MQQKLGDYLSISWNRSRRFDHNQIHLDVETSLSDRYRKNKNSAGTRLVEVHCTTVSTSKNLILRKVPIVQHEIVKRTELKPAEVVEDIGDGSDMIRYPTCDYLAPASIC